MAATKGQPAPKPSQIQASPAKAQKSVVDDFFADYDAPEMQAAPAVGEEAFTPVEAPQEDVPQQGAFQSPWYTEALPVAGGIIGGIAGTAAGPLGSIGGAALGGAAGQSYRDLIETKLLGKPQSAPMDVAKDIALAAGEEGAGQLVGMGIAKAAGKAASLASKYISAPIKEGMESIVKSVRSSVEEPLMKLLDAKTVPFNTEVAGDTAKNLLKQNIQAKYGPFIKAYNGLDEVANVTPIRDEARLGFTKSLTEWASENHAGDNYKIIKKFANDIDASNSMRQLNDVVSQINDARQVAAKSGAVKQAAMLKELRDKVTGFSENEITKLAARIQGGKASPQELMFFEKMVLQNGIQEPNPMKYAKSLADDYLKTKDKVRVDYAGFRSFLEDVGEQTKLRADNKGPMAFLNSLDDVPSEKLIERMFDKKNAAALRRMQKETPEVFDVVTKSKISQLVQKASPEGTLNLGKLRKEIYALPESTRSLLFSADELKTMNLVVSNPKLKRLEALERVGDNMLTRWAQDVANIGMIYGEGAMKSPKISAGVRQVVGNAAIAGGGKAKEMLTPKSKSADFWSDGDQ